MSEDTKGSNLLRLAVGAGVLAVAAVGVAVFVPRRRWVAMAEPFRGVLESPMALSLAAWATGVWASAASPNPPAFDDLRPFDEF